MMRWVWTATVVLAGIGPVMALPPQTGLVFHLDARDLPAGGKVNAGRVEFWRNLANGQGGVSQADPAHQPVFVGGRHPAVVFSGQQWLDSPAILPEGAKSFTIVAVWERRGSGDSESIVEQASPGRGRRAALLTTAQSYGFNGESNDQHNLWPYHPGRFAVSVLRLQPDGKVTLFHNGYKKTRLIDIGIENVGNEKLRVGGKIAVDIERLDGAISEILIYNRALGDDETKLLSDELVKKWGIQVEKSDPAVAAYQEMIRQNSANPNRYTEPYRPQYHFTPIEGWMNDPNGLVYFRGLWHLFYQHNTAGDDGSKAWGHAVSKDLLHWEHLPPAISPDDKGAIWSGSAVVDSHDSSGFFHGKPGIVCIFTYMNPAEGGRQSQGIAYSADGVTFTKYEHNPVIPQLRFQAGQPDESDFRDPKMFWNEATKRWIVIVAGGTVRLYSSPNLRDWTFESTNPDIHTECPDLFELPVEGEPGESLWVLSGAGRWYILGKFDGKTFTPESARIPFNYGPDFYASQTWSDAPEHRRIMITWMYNWGFGGQFPGRPGGGMTIPVQLTLRRTPDGLRVYQAPVQELQRLRDGHFHLDQQTLEDGNLPLPEVHGRQLEIIATFEKGGAAEFGVRVLKGEGGEVTTIGCRVEDGKMFLDRRQSGTTALTNWLHSYEAPLPVGNGQVKLHLFVDWSSVEVFGNDGREAITCNIFAPPGADKVELYAKGGNARLISLDAYPLKTVWRSAGH